MPILSLSAGRGPAALRTELLVARHRPHLDEAAVQALHLFALTLKLRKMSIAFTFYLFPIYLTPSLVLLLCNLK